ncbi:UPF0149 family protein [Marinobacteraceae bacterium S3BR75-40.1]
MTAQNPASDANDDVLDFDRWADLFALHSAFNHPCELHGALAGQLAAGERLSSERWEELALEHLGTEQLKPAEGEAPDPQAFLHAAYARVLASLQSEQMSFRLLLPDDRAPLEQRLEALGAWTRGFLEGMAVAAGEQLKRAPDDIRELVRDLVAITQVEPDEDDSEEGEQQFAEVAEYVRIGVLNVFTEFNRPDPDQAKSLH